MNTDKTLTEKFINRQEYPIWYYKELEETNLNFVIQNLLKTNFVVEITGSKYEITFGTNKKNEIGSYIRFDDLMKYTHSCSDIINKGFREGKWYTISNNNTSDEFKSNYRKRKEDYEKAENKEWYKEILSNFVNDSKIIDLEQKSKFLQQIEEDSYENLEHLVTKLFEKYK